MEESIEMRQHQRSPKAGKTRAFIPEYSGDPENNQHSSVVHPLNSICQSKHHIYVFSFFNSISIPFAIDYLVALMTHRPLILVIGYNNSDASRKYSQHKQEIINLDVRGEWGLTWSPFFKCISKFELEFNAIMNNVCCLDCVSRVCVCVFVCSEWRAWFWNIVFFYVKWWSDGTLSFKFEFLHLWFLCCNKFADLFIIVAVMPFILVCRTGKNWIAINIIHFIGTSN